MEFHKAKKVVIITEASILDAVIKMITKLGADDYTVQEATGKGGGGMKSGSGFLLNLFKNSRIEIITNEDIARKISVEIIEKFFEDYAGIVYIEDVEVVRATKFHVAGERGGTATI